jgi:hypothetical protein
MKRALVLPIVLTLTALPVAAQHESLGSQSPANELA